MKIIKSNGDRVPFDIEKVKASIRRTGASEELIERVAKDVSPKVSEGMTTREVYKMVFDKLEAEDTCFACRYNLRSAILRLGPAGFKFEKYVASILRAHNYDAYVPEDELQGSCVMHEVDVIANKDGRSIVIEAKFRNKYNHNVNLKDTMATWSRFLDLVDGAAVGKCQHFDEVWIVTNAKFSDRAQKFGVCKGVHMIGWDYPPERSFAGMVDNVALYPLTVLNSLKQSELESFSQMGWMLCREVSNKDPDEVTGKIGVSQKRAEEIINLCSVVVEGGDSEYHAHKNKK